MGLFDKVKKTLQGPVRIDLAVPPTFSWSDDSLPVTVSFTNESDDTHNIVEIEVELEKVVRSSKAPRGAGRKTKVHEPLRVLPGETVVRAVSLPVREQAEVSRADVEEWAQAQGAPAWAGRLAANQVGKQPPRAPLTGRHRVEVEITLAGASRSFESSTFTEAI